MFLPGTATKPKTSEFNAKICRGQRSIRKKDPHPASSGAQEKKERWGYANDKRKGSWEKKEGYRYQKGLSITKQGG